MGNKRYILLSLLLMSLNAVFSQSQKPNIIVIYTDDWGYADLSCQGSVNDVRTPNLDELARNGVRFTSGYCTAPQCSPSRAGMITGKYQQRFGFDEIPDGPLPLREETIANRLQKAGYFTGMVGKWHLEPNGVTGKWVQRNLPGATKDKRGRYEIPRPVTIPYLPGARGFNEYFEGNLQQYRANYDLQGKDLDHQGEWITENGYRLDIQTDAALTFIRRNHQKPFFLYLAYFAPHVPLQATREYLNRFPDTMATRRRYALAMISAVDDGVGRINKLLQQYGLDKNTIIFFASDNGAPLGMDKKDVPVANPVGIWDGSLNDPMRGEKGMLTEGGIRVPFILSWKDQLPEGVVYSNPVSTLDIAATALAAAGLHSERQLDGVNLVPFLKESKKAVPHKYLYWRFWTQSAVRNGKWKYIHAGENNEYLFDLDVDPGETSNLIKKYPAKARGLKAKIENWTQEMVPKGIPNRILRTQEKNWYNHYLGLDF